MKFDTEHTPIVAFLVFLTIMIIAFAVSSVYETRERQETIREIVKTIRVLQEKGFDSEAMKLTNALKEMNQK